MRTTILAAFAIAATAFGSLQAHAFCVYNESREVSTRVDAMHTGIATLGKSYSSGDLAPGQSSCCNYGNRDCNPGGSRTAMLDVAARVTLDMQAGYSSSDGWSAKCGDYHGTSEASTWAQVEAGGYLKFQKNPKFDYNQWVSPDNPPYVLLSFSHDNKVLKTYSCPSARTWADLPPNKPLQTALIKGLGGKCLDAEWQPGKGITASGMRVRTWRCTGEGNQRWAVRTAGATGSSLHHASILNASMNCLSVAGAKVAPGSRLVIWNCKDAHDDVDQQFTMKDGLIMLGPDNKLCADVVGGGTSDGTEVQLWACDKNNPNQRWSVQ